MIPTEKAIWEKTRTLVTQTGMPPVRAAVKAEGTAVGWLASIAGMLLCLIAGGIVIVLVLTRTELTLVVGLVVGIVAVLGLVVLFVGATLISRDAAPAIGKAGEFIVSLVRAIRGKNGS